MIKIKLIILLFLIVMLAGCAIEQLPEQAECLSDSDCVPSICCHPSECVPKEKAPDCTGIFCSMECVPGTLDCGQGSCVCDNGFCSVKWT